MDQMSKEETIQGLSIVVKTKENEQALKELAPYMEEYPLPEKIF